MTSKPPIRLLKPLPQPKPPIRFVLVKCPCCGRILGEATPGATVRLKCKDCRDFRVVEAA